MVDYIICDIDGTIANNQHRLHFIEKKPKRWDLFYGAMELDTPIEPVIRVLHAFNTCKFIIRLVSGRPEDYRKTTVQWLDRHGVPCHELHMRPTKDYRQDYIIKQEILQRLRGNLGKDPVLVIDDRKQVVDMWRAQGLVCLQCAEGDF